MGRHNGCVAPTTLTPQLERELADLQRRAYGPDADIHLDAAALARLRELEALSQTVSTASIGSFVEPAETAPIRAEPDDAPQGGASASAGAWAAAAAKDPAPARVDPAPERTGSPAESTGPPEPPAAAAPSPGSRRTWWRRPQTWILLGIGAVVGGVIVAAVLWAGSRPDLTLPVVDEGASSLESDSYLEYLELEPEALRSHGTYGTFGVWTGKTTRDHVCLLLTISASVWDQSCTPDGIDPIIDVTLFAGDFAARDLDLPERSVIRFVAKGDVVEVWIAVPAEPGSNPDLPSLLP